MWQNFQKVLEKRVNNKKIVKDDKYLIIKISEEVLVDFFGKIGKEFIQLNDYKDGVLRIELKNSIWRNEFKLNEKTIINKINNKINQKIINSIIISG